MKPTRIMILLTAVLVALGMVGLALGGASQAAAASQPKLIEAAPASTDTLAQPQAVISFTSGVVLIDIPDSSCPGDILSTILVTQDIAIRDLNVGVIIMHQIRSDLDVRLEDPGGMQHQLLATSAPVMNFNVLLNSDAPNGPGFPDTEHMAPLPKYLYTWKPIDTLTFANHQSALGTWTLRVCDHTANSIPGQLYEWSLWFSDAPETQPLNLSYIVAPAKVAWGMPISYTFTLRNNESFYPQPGTVFTDPIPTNTAFAGNLVCSPITTTAFCDLITLPGGQPAVQWVGDVPAFGDTVIHFDVQPLGVGRVTNDATYFNPEMTGTASLHTEAYVVPDVYMIWDFEDGPGGFVPSNSWSWSSTGGLFPPPFHSGPGTWGTGMAGNYDDFALSVLSTTYDVTGIITEAHVILEWWEYCRLAPGDVVEMMVNGSLIVELNDCTNNQWTHQEYEITGLVDGNNSIDVEWRLVPNGDSITDLGWFIDDVSIHSSPNQVDLQVMLWDAPDPVLPGGVVNYTLEVFNAGPTGTWSVSADAALPLGFNITATSSVCSGTDNNLLCESVVPSILPGETRLLTFTATAPVTTGLYVISANVHSGYYDRNPGNDSAFAETTVTDQMIDLEAQKTATPGEILAGDPLFYTIVITNLETISVTGVSVVDFLPGGLTFESAAPPICSPVPLNNVECLVGMLEAGERYTISLTAATSSSMPEGWITNTAEVRSDGVDPFPANNILEAATYVYSPADIEVGMTASPDPVTAGDPLTYTMVVTNYGPGVASGVLLTNSLPLSVSFVSSMPAVCSDLGGQVRCNLNSLSPATSQTLIIRAATHPAMLAGPITALADIHANQVDPDPSNNTASASTMVDPRPSTAPLLSSVEPAYAFNNVATTLDLYGINFTTGMTVQLTAFVLDDVSYISSTHLQATVPPGLPAATYDVLVIGPNGSHVLPAAFSLYVDLQPEVLSMTPEKGLNAVPVLVDIWGSNFSPDTQAHLSAGASQVWLEGIIFVDSSHLIGVVPMGIPGGVYTLTVANPAPGQADILPQAYESLDPNTYDDLFANPADLWFGPPSPAAGSIANAGLGTRRLGGADPLANVAVDFYISDTLTTTFLGRGTIDALLPNARVAATLTWPVPTAAGEYVFIGVIDPEEAFIEAIESNNVVTFPVSVRLDDGSTPPVIESFILAGGDGVTTQPTIPVEVNASNRPAYLYYVEYVFKQSTNTWEPVASSGWLPYETGRSLVWKLWPVPGAHYLRVWAASASGSITPLPASAIINLKPDDAHVAAQQGHIYRLDMQAGASLRVELLSLVGDADLYIWAPDGSLVDRRETSAAFEEILFTATMDGLYQVEVEGFTSADYQLGLITVMGLQNSQPVYAPHSPSLRGRGLPLSANPPPDMIGLPAVPELIYTTYLPVTLR